MVAFRGEVDAVLAVGFIGVARAAAVDGTAAGLGGMSYFCNCSKYESAVGIAPQQTSRVLVLARTS